MPNMFFGKGGISTCISRFTQPSKLIREKHPNRPTTHKLDNLVLIAEEKNKIWRNSGVSNVYIFSHANFKVVEFYDVRRYVHLTKEGR